MSTYTIGEVAARSGFSSSALRYYGQIGLVPPAGRTAAGYRVYDDDTLGRLAFVTRAKQLGCSLEEITDLIGVWDGARCASVQRRFHDLITRKLGAVHEQLDELQAFSTQLAVAAAHLGGEPLKGPCGERCACVIADESATPPIACALEPSSVPAQVAARRPVSER